MKKSSKVLLENKLLDSWQLPVCGLHVTSLATGSRQEDNLNCILCKLSSKQYLHSTEPFSLHLLSYKYQDAKKWNHYNIRVKNYYITLNKWTREIIFYSSFLPASRYLINHNNTSDTDVNIILQKTNVTTFTL